ncbi:hypothetical protein BC830DRAFT_1163281 [Chytriomyces sp. MP71]|nr:hypothetical protein BC830DRAFT_1163281 [Chytriomyces sp. MP71]
MSQTGLPFPGRGPQLPPGVSIVTTGSVSPMMTAAAASPSVNTLLLVTLMPLSAILIAAVLAIVLIRVRRRINESDGISYSPCFISDVERAETDTAAITPPAMTSLEAPILVLLDEDASPYVTDTRFRGELARLPSIPTMTTKPSASLHRVARLAMHMYSILERVGRYSLASENVAGGSTHSKVLSGIEEDGEVQKRRLKRRENFAVLKKVSAAGLLDSYYVDLAVVKPSAFVYGCAEYDGRLWPAAKIQNGRWVWVGENANVFSTDEDDEDAIFVLDSVEEARRIFDEELTGWNDEEAFVESWELLISFFEDSAC